MPNGGAVTDSRCPWVGTCQPAGTDTSKSKSTRPKDFELGWLRLPLQPFLSKPHEVFLHQMLQGGVTYPAGRTLELMDCRYRATKPKSWKRCCGMEPGEIHRRRPLRRTSASHREAICPCQPGHRRGSRLEGCVFRRATCLSFWFGQ